MKLMNHQLISTSKTERSVNSNMIFLTLMYLKQMRLKRILMRVTHLLLEGCRSVIGICTRRSIRRWVSCEFV